MARLATGRRFCAKPERKQIGRSSSCRWQGPIPHGTATIGGEAPKNSRQRRSGPDRGRGQLASANPAPAKKDAMTAGQLTHAGAGQRQQAWASGSPTMGLRQRRTDQAESTPKCASQRRPHHIDNGNPPPPLRGNEQDSRMAVDGAPRPRPNNRTPEHPCCLQTSDRSGRR